MTWFRLDDDFADHDKVLALESGPCPDAAIAAWTRCASWTSHADKGGFVPGPIALRYARMNETVLSELVRVGLWLPAHGGYQFHDWADYNPSGERLEEKRRLAAARKAKHRAKLASAKAVDAGNQPALSVNVSEERVPNASVTQEERSENATAALGDRERDLSSSVSSSEVVPACEPTRPSPDNVLALPTRPRQPDGSYNSKDLAKDFSAIRAAAGRGSYTARHSDYQLAQEVLEWAFEKYPADPRAACVESIGNFVHNAPNWERVTRGLQFPDWAKDPGRWHELKSRGPATKKAGPSEVASHEKYQRAAAGGGEPCPF
jgi:hypothetical protein